MGGWGQGALGTQQPSDISASCPRALALVPFSLKPLLRRASAYEALEKYPAYYKETYGEELDMELYNIMAPSTEVLKKCENYVVLPEETRTLYNDLWIQLGL